jgi:hypothetical protein
VDGLGKVADLDGRQSDAIALLAPKRHRARRRPTGPHVFAMLRNLRREGRIRIP